ncbi:MAG: hypothetical protein EZS28_047748, partial [Streblomastix strix]
MYDDKINNFIKQKKLKELEDLLDSIIDAGLAQQGNDQNIALFIRVVDDITEAIRSITFKNPFVVSNIMSTLIPRKLINLVRRMNILNKTKSVYIRTLGNLIYVSTVPHRDLLIVEGILEVLAPNLYNANNEVSLQTQSIVFFLVRTGIKRQSVNQSSFTILQPHPYLLELKRCGIINKLFEFGLQRTGGKESDSQAAIMIGWLYGGAALPKEMQSIVTNQLHQEIKTNTQNISNINYALQALAGLAMAQANHSNITANDFLKVINNIIKGRNIDIKKCALDI